MKLKFRDISKEGTGYVRLLPEEAEDMWHVYNLLAVGDSIRSTTVRCVRNLELKVTELGAFNLKLQLVRFCNNLIYCIPGTSSSERVRVTLTIEVESIAFDAQSGVLRLSGKNVTENKYVKAIEKNIFFSTFCIIRWELITRWIWSVPRSSPFTKTNGMLSL
jgi:protein pelota